MSLPYYARNRNTHDIRPPEVDVVLYWPDVVKAVGHVSKLGLKHLHPEITSNLINGIAFIEHASCDRPAATNIFRGIVEVYHELMSLAADLGKADALYELYACAFNAMQEGQNDLFNSNEIVREAKDGVPEVHFRTLLDKYHVQHEGNLRYSIAPVVFALDLVSGHKDASEKSAADYCKDELSYKYGKIQAQTHVKIKGGMAALLTGIEPHVRNSISHRSFEYLESGSIRFDDRDKRKGTEWYQTYSFEQFKRLVFDADNAINAHVAAQTIFLHDYEKHIRIDPVGSFATTKQLKTLIDQRMLKLTLQPVDISLPDDKVVLSCTARRVAGSDHPSEIMGKMAGVMFSRTRPPINPEDQALLLLHFIASLKPGYQRCELRILDSLGKAEIGRLESNLERQSSIVSSQTPSKEDFMKEVTTNTFA